MTPNQIRNLLNRAAEGEDVDQLMREVDAEANVLERQRDLEDAIRDDDDLTGQDNEEEIDQRASDLISARDRLLRIRDPEAYNEQRQMGLLE